MNFPVNNGKSESALINRNPSVQEWIKYFFYHSNIYNQLLPWMLKRGNQYRLKR